MRDDQPTDDALRQMMIDSDPLRGADLGAPSDAAMLRDLGERLHPMATRLSLAGRAFRRLRRHGSWLTFPAVAATIMAVALGIGAFDIQLPGPSLFGSQVEALSYWPEPSGASTRELLRALADRAARQPDVERQGAATFVHTREFSADQPETSDGAVLHDVRLWWLPDRSGRRVSTPLAAAEIASHVSAPPPASGTEGQTVDYGPGELTLPVEQPSADFEVLAAQLYGASGTDRPQDAVRAVARLHQHYAPTPALRGAVLMMLSDLALRSLGTATTRFGEQGLAFGVDGPDGVDDVLIFDPSTGALLDYEQTSMQPQGTVVVAFIVFLEATQVAMP